MTVGGFIPLEVEEFGGLHSNIVTALDAPVYQGSAKGKIRTSALEAKNLRFLPGGWLGRDGLTTAFDFGGTRKATHIAQLITQQDQRQILVVADDGGLYREPAAGQTLVALKTDWAPATAIGHSATLFDREHLAVSDGRVGVGSPLVWDRTNLDRMSPSPPGASHTLALGAAGSVTNGIHGIAIIFETRHGHRIISNATKSGADIEINVTSTKKIVVSNIPLGPDWIVKRIVAMTTAAGASFFFVTDDSAGMIIDDNTTTTATIDVADATLSAGTLVDRLFRRMILPEQAGMLSYGSRLVTWGGRSRIPFPNLDFDGGFDPADLKLPAGWIEGAGGENDGSAKETSDTYLGHALKVTGDGATAVRAHMNVGMPPSFGEAFLQVGKKYKIRFRAKRSAGVTQGNIQFRLNSTSNDFPFVAITSVSATQFGIHETELASGLTEVAATGVTQMKFRVTGTLDSGESVIIDDIQLMEVENEFQSSIVRVSDAESPEAFDNVKGFLQVSPDDGQKVVTAFKYRDLLFICKERSLYVTRDDGVNPPSLWPVNFVDNIGCDSLHGAATAGEQFAIISYRAGVYAIFGLRPVKVNQEIQQSPAGFVSWDDREEPQAYKNHVMIDAEKKNVFVSVVRRGGTWPNRTFVLNYWKGWGEQERKWSHDQYLEETALVSSTGNIGTVRTIGNSGLSMTVDEHIGNKVVITSGPLTGEVRTVISNTATLLTHGGPDLNFGFGDSFEVRGSPGMSASKLIEESGKQSLFFGWDELNLYRHANGNDDGDVIEHSYRGAFAGFQGSYGDNLFGALAIHGLTSGSNLIIEALLIDETLNTLSQAGGETLTAAKYLELQTNLTALKLSYRLRSNTLNATIKVDSMTIWGRAWHAVGVM